MDKARQAYDKSIALLHDLASEAGFLATTSEINNYRRVWARDGIIAGIAALASGDQALISAFEKTLATLKRYQDKTGRIPSNVSVEKESASYGTTVGRVDATLWYAIGASEFARRTGNESFWSEYKPSVARALAYLECLEGNGRGFIYVPQGGDWADEYINEGYVLYDELLYYFALSSYSQCEKDQHYIEKKDYLREMIRINYLPKKEHVGNQHVYHEALYRRLLKEYVPPLPVSYFSNHAAGFNLDTFACSLFLLSDIPDEDERKGIEKAVLEHAEKDFPILPAFHPVISSESSRWNELENNFLFEFRNAPYQYHNGGLWPLVHGFFVASLERGRAESELSRFAEVLARDGYSFPEYYDGQTFEPKGIMPLGFSAAAFVLAYESVKNGKRLFCDNRSKGL